ncbi:MAG TPA: hypothetical protein VNU71_00045 [Burkholderiaceae bacterium]|nr:hypothetical protein [Burkholderiaceae bacterium]
MSFIKALGAAAVLLALAACGGGSSGEAGTSPFGTGSGSGTGGAGGGTTPIVATDLSLSLSANSVDNSGSKTVLATVTAVDASRNALPAVPVTFSVDNNAVAQASGTVTAAAGTVTATVSIGADRTNRIITVTATSGSLVRTASFQVTGAQLSANVITAVTAPGSTGNSIQYRLVDANAAAMVGQKITVSAAGLADVNGLTDNSGVYIYNFTAPATTGNLAVTANAGGTSVISTILVQSTSGGAVPPAGSIQSASITANPSVVSVNSSTSSSNRSDARALFLGVGNAPVQNVRVRFDLPDPNSIGGTLSTQSNVVYTDGNGVATTTYIPGTRSSPTDGVIVRACYSTTDFAAGTCPNSVTTTLTVISEALALSIGTDNTISDGTGGLTFIKKFVVLVVDSSGQAKANVQLSASIDLVAYIKGYFDGPGGWNRDSPSALHPVPVLGAIGFTGPTCPNEDTNRNGVLETVNGISEDINQNGQLDPRKSDVAVSFVGPSLTASNGTAVIQIEYPKNVATWVDYKILVAASGVSGTEGRTSWSGRLGADEGSFTATVAPAFVVSPYGVSPALPASMSSNPSGGSIADGCYNKN